MATLVETRYEPRVSPSPPNFHLLAKPSGSTCNIDCKYCFFLSKEALYPDDKHRMSDATLEAYISQLLAAHQTPRVTVAWQGGEPTIMRLDFFRRAMALVEKHRRPGQIIEHTFQTNGLLIDEDWCRFFKEHKFLVGISIDGPESLHDANRVDRRGQGTFARVMQGLEQLRRHRVDFNILCTVNAANEDHGRQVYRFFRDDLGARWIQFIPIVERSSAETLAIANRDWRLHPGDKRLLYTQSGDMVTDRSVGRRQYGQFLIDVFEEWVRHDIGHVYIQLFDVTLEASLGRHKLCLHAPTCGLGPALEYNGDLYACDHFVEPAYKLGNIHDTPMGDLVGSAAMRRFGQDKRDRLTAQCLQCDVLNLCNGGCPKDRFITSDTGELGHNYLCEGLTLFYHHTAPAMQAMRDLLASNRAPAELMAQTRATDQRLGPYRPCPCGSGRKFRFCHGGTKP